MPLCAEDSSASRAMSWALAESSSVAEASVVELSPIAVMTVAHVGHRGLERRGHPADLVPALDAGRAAQVAVGHLVEHRADLAQRADDRRGDDPAEHGEHQHADAGDDQRERDRGRPLALEWAAPASA